MTGQYLHPSKPKQKISVDKKKSIILQSPVAKGASSSSSIITIDRAAMERSKNGFKTAKNTTIVAAGGKSFNPMQRPVLAKSVLDGVGNVSREWTPAKRARRMDGEEREKQMETN